MLREYGLVPKTATNVGPTTKIQLFSTPLVKLHKLDINCRRRRPEMFRISKRILQNSQKNTSARVSF